jgi:drug/metabolite transporter (DMT)-like permease
MNLKKWGPWLVLFAAMLWATDAPFRVHLTRELSITFIILAEHFIDVLFILPILWWKRGELKSLGKNEWLAVLVIAVGSSALASLAYTKAFSYVNPSVAIVLQKLQPLIAIGLAASLLKEELRMRFWVWAFVAIAGAYAVSFPDLSPRFFEGEIFNPNFMGVTLALTAAVLWGAGTVLGKSVLSKASFQTMTALRFLLAFIFLLGVNAYEKSFPVFGAVSARTWLYIVVVAVTSGVVSLFIYYKGLAYTKASIAALAELGFPLAAVLVNYFVLDSKLQAEQVLGMGLLLFAIFNLTKVNREAPEKCYELK